MRTILFICSGNTCRSPMAEAIARHWLRQQAEAGAEGVGAGDAEGHGIDPADVLVASAGVYAGDGMPPNDEAIDALERVGIEHRGRSKSLTADMVIRADAVLCMTQDHIAAVRDLLRAAESKPDMDAAAGETIIELVDPDVEIADPIGQGAAAYDKVLSHLRTIIPDRLKEILSHEGRSGIRSSR